MGLPPLICLSPPLICFLDESETSLSFFFSTALFSTSDLVATFSCSPLRLTVICFSTSDFSISTGVLLLLLVCVTSSLTLLLDCWSAAASCSLLLPTLPLESLVVLSLLVLEESVMSFISAATMATWFANCAAISTESTLLGGVPLG